MTPIRDGGVPASLDEVAARVRHSSNFRFAWQWFDLLHEHSRFREATLEFEKTLARAAADRLGAYSRHLTDAEPADVEMVRRSFGSAAPYTVFVLEPGRATGCTVCETHNGYLFTNWFYGVAWDWCFCLLSRTRPSRGLGF